MEDSVGPALELTEEGRGHHGVQAARINVNKRDRKGRRGVGGWAGNEYLVKYFNGFIFLELRGEKGRFVF